GGKQAPAYPARALSIQWRPCCDTTPKLKTEGLVRRWRRRVAPFHLEHSLFGRGAAGRGEAAELAASREHAMTRNDQRHRILCHCLADAARNFVSLTHLFLSRALGRL